MMHNPLHPGKVIREELINTLGLTVTEAADKLAMSRGALSRVLNCRAAVSVELAIALEQAGISTARAWLAMQISHDLAQALKKPQKKIRLLYDHAI